MGGDGEGALKVRPLRRGVPSRFIIPLAAAPPVIQGAPAHRMAASLTLGGIAQLVERLVRNEKVRSSNLLTSTKSESGIQVRRVMRGLE